jgi:hypothetical protein
VIHITDVSPAAEHNRAGEWFKKGSIQMLKRGLAVGAALVLVPLTALGAPLDRQPGKSFPLILGSYAISLTRACQPSLQVAYSNIGGHNVVTGVSMISGAPNTLSAGSLSATNSKGSGSLTGTVTQAQGDPIVVQDNLGGEWGTLLSGGAGSGSVTFVQTATTLSITDTDGTSTYNIYYGPAKKGNAVNAVFGGIDIKGCMDVGSITRQ